MRTDFEKEYEREINRVERETFFAKIVFGVLLFASCALIISLMIIWMFQAVMEDTMSEIEDFLGGQVFVDNLKVASQISLTEVS